MLADYYHLSPSEQGGRGRGLEEKVKGAGEERGLYLGPGAAAAPVWGQMYRCPGDSKKFIISSKYRGPARVHRGDNIDADVFCQSVGLFYIYQNGFYKCSENSVKSA